MYCTVSLAAAGVSERFTVYYCAENITSNYMELQKSFTCFTNLKRKLTLKHFFLSALLSG